MISITADNIISVLATPRLHVFGFHLDGDLAFVVENGVEIF